jgi:hypothetical protein
MPDKITVSLPDGKTAAAIVNLVVGKKKPPGWSRKSYATYYKESYALWLKKDLDQMIADRQSVVYRYDKWPRVRPSALYQRIIQALMYVLDELDPDGTYKRLREQIRITRPNGVGVVLSFDEVLEGQPQGERFVGAAEKPRWYKKMFDYLEDMEIVEPFHIDKLMLTPEEVEQIKAELDGLSNIMFSVTSREIKIIKGS